MLAREMGMLKVGKISVDGTKVKANASKHRALSWEHLVKIEKLLWDEVKQLLALAESEDRNNLPDGMNVPQEIARREERLAVMGEAKRKLEERARERDAAQQAEFDTKSARRDAQRKAGKKPRGKDPEPPTTGPQDKDQINLTDEQSRIMKVSGGGFEQCYNGQCAVDAGSMLIVATGVTQACNDKQQIKPMLAMLKSHEAELGKPEQLCADTGYFSAANVDACVEAGVEPMIEVLRQLITIWELEGFVGVDSQHQFKSRPTSFRGRVVYFDYGAFWCDLGGTREPDGNWRVPVNSTRKSIEEVESKKRSMYRRCFALLDSMGSHLSDMV